MKARDPGRRETPGKVLKDRRSPRELTRSHGNRCEIERTFATSVGSTSQNVFGHGTGASPDLLSHFAALNPDPFAALDGSCATRSG